MSIPVKFIAEVNLPYDGYIDKIYGEHNLTKVFYDIKRPAQPRSIYELDMRTLKSKPYMQADKNKLKE